MTSRRGLAIWAAGVYGFLHLPVLILIAFSFNQSRFTVWTGFSWRWYRALAADPRILRSLGNSLAVAVISTAVATAIGTLAAYAMRRFPGVGNRTLDQTLRLSIVTPEMLYRMKKGTVRPKDWGDAERIARRFSIEEP